MRSFLLYIFIISTFFISNLYAETLNSKNNSKSKKENKSEPVKSKEIQENSLKANKNNKLPHIHGVEIRLLPIFSRGLSLDYEIWLFERFSFQGGLGIRSSAMGDYSGLATTMTIGSRFWLHKWGASWFTAPYSGFFAEINLNFQITTVYDEIDKESLPWTYTTALGLGTGFRFLIMQCVTFTTTIGILMRVDNPEGPARSQTRTNIIYGLRAGYLF